MIAPGQKLDDQTEQPEEVEQPEMGDSAIDDDVPADAHDEAPTELDAEDLRDAGAKRPRMKRSQIVTGALLGTVVTILVGVIVIVAINRNSLPMVTAERLETSKYLWRHSEIDSYHMSIDLQGAQPGTIEIEVEDGKPVSMLRDGVVPPQRTWDVWTITGQFETIEKDLLNKESPLAAFRVEDPADVSIAAVFDSRTGIPRHYRRLVQGQPYTVEWIITEFTPKGR